MYHDARCGRRSPVRSAAPPTSDRRGRRIGAVTGSGFGSARSPGPASDSHGRRVLLRIGSAAGPASRRARSRRARSPGPAKLRFDDGGSGAQPRSDRATGQVAITAAVSDRREPPPRNRACAARWPAMKDASGAPIRPRLRLPAIVHPPPRAWKPGADPRRNPGAPSPVADHHVPSAGFGPVHPPWMRGRRPRQAAMIRSPWATMSMT